jgi:hypothetical protein
MSRHNTQTLNSPLFLIQNTPNDVLVSARYFPVLLDINLQNSLELDMEILLTAFNIGTFCQQQYQLTLCKFLGL